MTLLANYNVILGSSSAHRQKILLNEGIKFEVVAPNIDENSYVTPNNNPSELALKLAVAKNQNLQSFLPIAEPTIIITADQVVTCNGKVRGKPKNNQQAREFLKSYALHPAQTISALSVYNSKSRVLVSDYDLAEITLHLIPDPQIEAIINEGTIFSCAGGFAIEHPLMSPFVKEIKGTQDSVIGLPLATLNKLISLSLT